MFNSYSHLADHFKVNTIRTLAKERPTLRFGCCEWLVSNLIECGVNKRNIDLYETDKTYDYGVCQITPVPLIHNAPNCGYKIIVGNDKYFYATDTNTLSHIDAVGYDVYLVEANYTEEDIYNRISEKIEKGQYAYEFDVLKNHLSKEKCDEWLSRNMDWNGSFIYMHQHVDKTK